MSAVLSDIRVIDATDVIGHYAGYLLADLGADVIKVEPLDGDPTRRWLPALPDAPESEAGLQFLLLNANKRSVALDLDDPSGRAAFLRLVKSADIVLESWSPARASELGFAPAELREVNPGLIHASITEWGLSGPLAGVPSSDMVAVAQAGLMHLNGVLNGPPRNLPDHQGYRCASINAAAGVMAALLHRDETGIGQLVEVSMQEALLIAQETAMQQADILGTDRERLGGLRPGGFKMPGLGIYETADGFIFAMCSGNAGSGFPGLVDLIEEMEGRGPLQEEPLATFARNEMNAGQLMERIQDPEQAPQLLETLARIDTLVTEFFRRHSKTVLYERGQQRRVLLGAVNAPPEVSADEQLRARDWFRDVFDPTRGRTLRYPGPPWMLERTPAHLGRPAPRLGEHTREVLEEAGVPADELLAGGGAQ